MLWTKHSSVSLQEASPDEENEPSEGDSLLLKKKIQKHNPELEESYDALQMRPSLETRLTLRTRLTDVVALLVDRWRRQCLPRFNRTSLALFTRSLI